MMVLAIDGSTKSSGIAVFENQELKHYECITASNSNIFIRIRKMTDRIEEIVKEYNIDRCVLEDVTLADLHNNVKVFKTLTYLQGFILAKLDEYKIEVKLMMPSEWRKKCGIHTGRGVLRETLKKKDIQFAKSQFGVDVGDDIADALGIGFAAVGGVIKEPQTIIDEDGFEFG